MHWKQDLGGYASAEPLLVDGQNRDVFWEMLANVLCRLYSSASVDSCVN